MRFKDVFSIIGPAMVGPSSSHTAGAVRIGRVARRLLGELPNKAGITLYGSFADTYRGHGTDAALIAGILDYDTDDARIPNALEQAAMLGMEVSFEKGTLPDSHPNTVRISIANQNQSVCITGASIGGGNVEIHDIDGFEVHFSAMYPTLLIIHPDSPGEIAAISTCLRDVGINIGRMSVDRRSRSGKALSVIEMDQPLLQPMLRALEKLNPLYELKYVNLAAEEGSSL